MKTMTEPHVQLHSSEARNAPMGHALWQYAPEGWLLKEDLSAVGGMPGPPPARPGLFVGQIRATPSAVAS